MSKWRIYYIDAIGRETSMFMIFWRRQLFIIFWLLFTLSFARSITIVTKACEKQVVNTYNYATNNFLINGEQKKEKIKSIFVLFSD